MSSAVVEIDVNEVKKLTDLLNGKALSSADRRNLLQSLGPEMVEQSRSRILETQKSPDGKPWADFADSTLRYLEKQVRAGSVSLLNRSGDLHRSITSEVKNDWAVLVGACMEYAAVHQFGYSEKNIPARPYLGVSSDDVADLTELTKIWLEGHLK